MTLAANFARPGRLARPFWHLAQHLHTRQCCVRARRRGRFGEQNWGEEHCLACSAAASSCLVWNCGWHTPAGATLPGDAQRLMSLYDEHLYLVEDKAVEGAENHP